MEVDTRKVFAVIVVVIAAIYLMSDEDITANPKEIPCEDYDECFRISEEYGLDKTIIECEGIEGMETCKVIVE